MNMERLNPSWEAIGNLCGKTWESFFTRVNRTMNLVQPLVFIFVALLIVLLYAAMLLPMYQNMEVNF